MGLGLGLRRKRPDEAFAYGFLPFFLLTTASYYYYVARVTLWALHASGLPRGRHAVGLVMLVGTEIFANWAERTHDGQMQAFKPGLLLLLKKIRCPIVPVGIAGTYQTLNRHQKRPSFCTIFTPPDDRCIAISVGKPITPEVYGQWSRDELLAKLFDAVQAQEGEAKKLQRKKRG